MSSVSPDDDPALHRLEGSSGNQQGGLIIMKKGPNNDSDKHTFKKPSLLGLDKLAAAKRSSDLESGSEKKRSKVTSYKDDDDFSSSSGSSSDEEDKVNASKQSRKERCVNTCHLLLLSYILWINLLLVSGFIICLQF